MLFGKTGERMHYAIAYNPTTPHLLLPGSTPTHLYKPKLLFMTMRTRFAQGLSASCLTKKSRRTSGAYTARTKYFGVRKYNLVGRGGCMRGWGKTSLILLLIATSTGCIFWTSDGDSRANEIVPIKISVGQDGYITINIPRKYIGPSKLNLSQESLKL